MDVVSSPGPGHPFKRVHATSQVLGVTRAASRESCLKASEQLLANVSDVGYSSDLILSRALVLEATTNVLTDYTARHAYDCTPQVEIPYDELPGAASCRPHEAPLHVKRPPHTGCTPICDMHRVHSWHVGAGSVQIDSHTNTWHCPAQARSC